MAGRKRPETAMGATNCAQCGSTQCAAAMELHILMNAALEMHNAKLEG